MQAFGVGSPKDDMRRGTLYRRAEATVTFAERPAVRGGGELREGATNDREEDPDRVGLPKGQRERCGARHAERPAAAAQRLGGAREREQKEEEHALCSRVGRMVRVSHTSARARFGCGR